MLTLYICNKPHFVSVNDTMFKPGSITAQSSDSASKANVSSRPENVNAGAVEDDTSMRKMKSLAVVAYLGGKTTTIGVASDDTGIVVIVWSLTLQHSDDSMLDNAAVSRA